MSPSWTRTSAIRPGRFVATSYAVASIRPFPDAKPRARAGSTQPAQPIDARTHCGEREHAEEPEPGPSSTRCHRLPDRSRTWSAARRLAFPQSGCQRSRLLSPEVRQLCSWVGPPPRTSSRVCSGTGARRDRREPKVAPPAEITTARLARRASRARSGAPRSCARRARAPGVPARPISATSPAAASFARSSRAMPSRFEARAREAPHARRVLADAAREDERIDAARAPRCRRRRTSGCGSSRARARGLRARRPPRSRAEQLAHVARAREAVQARVLVQRCVDRVGREAGLALHEERRSPGRGRRCACPSRAPRAA